MYLVQWGEGAARKRRKVLLAGENDGRRCWGSGLSRSFGGERRLFGNVQTMVEEMEGLTREWTVCVRNGDVQQQLDFGE